MPTGVTEELEVGVRHSPSASEAHHSVDKQDSEVSQIITETQKGAGFETHVHWQHRVAVAGTPPREHAWRSGGA